MRKKDLLLTMVTLALCWQAQAQINASTNAYTFASAAGTYTPLTAARTVITTAIGTNTFTGAIPLPSPFKFNNKNYNSVRVANNGAVYFGLLPTSPTTVSGTPLSAGGSAVVTSGSIFEGVISPACNAIVASTLAGALPELSYETVGSEFIVQLTDAARSGTGIAAVERFSFQVRLNLTSNVIRFVYNGFVTSSTSTTTLRVGLRGAAGDVINRTSTSSWSASTAGGTAPAGMSYTTTVRPADGLTYTWTPPLWTLGTPVYAPLPYTQDFDATWANGTAVEDLPQGTNWRTWPSRGEFSWKQSISQTTPGTGFATNSGWISNAGTFNIAAPASGGVARFNSYNPAILLQGYMDLYVDFSPAGVKTLKFDHYDPTEISDSLEVLLSTNGGANFTPMATYGTTDQAGWNTRTLGLGTGNSSTCIIRFRATANWGSDDIGIDNVSIVSVAGADASITSITTPVPACTPSNTVSITVKNEGTTIIPAGVMANLKITGANPQGPLSQSTVVAINPGDIVTLNFTASFTNPGLNFDTAYLQTVAGDGNQLNDTIRTSHTTLSSPASFPYVEDFESGVPTGWTISQLLGAGLWTIAANIPYPDMTPAQAFAPKSGSNLAFFDSYNYLNGTNSRLTTRCITLPTIGAGTCEPVVGFYAAQDGQYSNADSIFVSIRNATGTTTTLLGKVARYDSSLAWSIAIADRNNSRPTWRLITFNLPSSFSGQSVQFLIDAYARFGNSMAIDSFFVNNKAAATNVGLAGSVDNDKTLIANAVCDEAGWTYYAAPSSAKYVFGVNWGSNAAAKAGAVAKIWVDRNYFSNTDIATKQGTWTMKRYWDIDLNGSTLSTPVNVRFFYEQSDLDSMINAKNAFLATTAGIDEGVKWFKVMSGAFVPNTTIVTTDGVMNSTELMNTNSGGARINGVLYAQFNGLTSFSGGTAAAGVGNNTPLPIRIEYFKGTKAGLSHILDWKVAPLNSNKGILTLERSNDNRSFAALYTINATAQMMMQPFSYTETKLLNGINFYRLKMVDEQGLVTYSNVVALSNASKGWEFVSIYPNPVTDSKYKLNLFAGEQGIVNVITTDLTGRIVAKQLVNVSSGLNTVEMNTGSLANGSYRVYGITKDGRTKVLQFVKR